MSRSLFLPYRNIRGRFRGSNAPAPTMTFGALTIVGAGATPISDADGTYGPYTVSGGLLTPNTSPVTPGDYTVGSTIVTAEADVYECADGGLAAIIALGAATINGKTIKGVAGSDLIGTNNGDTQTFANSLTFTTGLNITSRDVGTPAYLRRMNFIHNGYIHFTNLIIRDYFVFATDLYENTSIIRWQDNPTGTSKATFDNCVWYSDDVTQIDTTTKYAGTCHTGGVSSNVLTLTGTDDISAILGGRLMGCRVQAPVVFGATISSIDYGLREITFIGDPRTIAAGTPAVIEIGDVVACLNGVGQDGFQATSNDPVMEITNSVTHDLNRHILGVYSDLLLENNDHDLNYSDFLSLGYTGEETRFDILNNKFRRAAAPSTVWSNPHPDFIQINQGPMTQDSAVKARVNGNIECSFGSPIHSIQPIFFENASGTYKTWIEIMHNVISSVAGNGIAVEYMKAGSLIAFNTMIADAAPGDASPLIPYIRLDNAEAGSLVAYNVHPGYTGTNDNTTRRADYEWTGNTPADYAALLTGPDAKFDSDNITSFDDFLTAMTPDGNATLWPAYEPRKGALGGYYDYTTRVSSSPLDASDWSPNVVWGNLIDQTVDTVVTSNKVQITGITANGIEVRIDSASDATLSLFDTDGTTLLASGKAQLLVHENQYVQITMTTSGSNEVAYTVTVSSGTNATTGTWSVTTEAGAWAINAVRFDGTAWAHTGAFSTPETKLGFLALTFKWNAAYSAREEIFVVGKAGQGSRLELYRIATGRITFVIRNSAGGTVLLATSASGLFADDTYYNMQIGWDTTTGVERLQWYVDGSQITYNSTPTIVADGIIGTNDQFAIATDTAAGRYVANMDIADLVFSTFETIDFSVAGNRAKFANTAFKGADGSIPTGTQPIGFFADDTASWHINKGSGGGLTEYGTITTAPVQPT